MRVLIRHRSVMKVALLTSVVALSLSGWCELPGVVLRFDDVHPVGQWRDLIDAFDSEGFKASLAIPMGSVRNEHVEFLRQAQLAGHELMDHTYDHATYSHWCQTAEEYREVCRRRFVAERDAANRFVGFRFDFDRDHPGNFPFEGMISNGILVVSKSIAAKLHRPNKIYVPRLDRFFGFYDDPEGRIVLRSFYTYRIKEKAEVSQSEMLLCDHRAFSISDEALRYQAKCSRDAFMHYGLSLPKSWIQPGGWDSWMPVDQFVRVYAGDFGYVAADCIMKGNRGWNGDPAAPNPAIARYAFCPELYFDVASVSPAALRARILECQKKGKGVCFISHMTVPPTMKRGRQEWLDETRSLLKWLKKEEIPVRTFSEMASFLWGRQSSKGSL